MRVRPDFRWYASKLAGLPALLSLATVAFGKPAVAPIDYLVNHSDLIVVGTLGEVSKRPGLRAAHEHGIIAVTEVLWGPGKPGDRLRLDWDYQYFIGESCNRLEFGWAKGQPGIWFLTIAKPGRVRADDHGRFVFVGDLPEVRKKIATGVGVRTPYFGHSPGEPMLLFMVVRNPGPGSRAFPTMERREQSLYLDPRLHFELRPKPSWNTYGDPLSPKDGRVRASTQASSFDLGAGQERRLEFDVTTTFDLTPGQCYSARLRIDGMEAGAEAEFCMPGPIAVFSSAAPPTSAGASLRVPIK